MFPGAEAGDRRFEGVSCTLTIREPAPGVVVVALAGNDIGEFGEKPMEEVASRITASGRIELFIDAREARAASLDVTGDWAQWLRARRADLLQVSLLTGSRFITLSADVVRRFGELGEKMRLYTEPEAFDEALRAAVGARE
jgi:hypothetical protein